MTTMVESNPSGEDSWLAKRSVMVNGAFIGQRVTGQQRYAHEICKRLVAEPNTVVTMPSEHVRASRTLAWAWALCLPILHRRPQYILSLTSRGPIFSRRSVQVVHDLFPLTNPEWFSLSYRITHRFVLKLQLRTAAVLVAVSEPIAEQVRALKSPRQRVIVAPNAPAEVFRPSTACREVFTSLEPFGLTPDSYILCVGSIDPRKNTARLLAAYDRLPVGLKERYPLIMVGGGSKNFGHVAEPIRGSRRLGYVSDEDLAALYEGARVVAFLSLNEGFGLPAVEALACGARLLVSDLPVMRWVCGDLAEYVNPVSVDAIQAALKACLRSGPCDSRVKEWRSEQVRARFSWESSACQISKSLRVAPSAW